MPSGAGAAVGMVDGPPAFPDGSGYNFIQTPTSCVITIPILAESTKKDIDVKLTDDSAVVTVHSHIRFKGRLFASIKKKDCVWHIEDYPEDPKAKKSAALSKPHRYKLLTIFLQKVAKYSEWQTPVVKGILNEDDADPHSLFLIASARHDASESSSLKRMITAGQQGSVAAMLKLAAWYELGREEMDIIPVPRDPLVSLDWHRKAAIAGNAEACYIVMTAFASGSHGCTKSYLEGVKWAKASIEAGGGEELFRKEQESLFVTVAFQGGLMLMEGGHGLGDPDPKAAAELWKHAAEVDHGQSCWNLGIFHLNGFGVKVDIKLGVELVRKGMKKVTTLSLPPQLQGLTEKNLDDLVKLADAEQKEGRQPSLDALVKLVKAGKSSAKPAKPLPKKQESKKNDTNRETLPLDSSESIRRNIAITAIVLGVIGVFVALRQNP